ncbi:MAG: hypothetical protein CM1200mP16_11830 [Nitrospina sp.]|nr:MAG: hypothetical protein CM1200mP16_11830 [Nitrospina sp.]
MKPFGCNILVNDIEDKNEFCREQSAIETSFEILINESDIVSLHVLLQI